MKTERQKIKALLEQDHEQPVSAEELEAMIKMLAVLESEDRSVTLPPDFSASVINRIVQNKIRENRLTWLGYCCGIFALIICLIISLLFVDFKPDFGFLKSISRYSGLFVFGSVFIIVLNLMDRSVLKRISE